MQTKLLFYLSLITCDYICGQYITKIPSITYGSTFTPQNTLYRDGTVRLVTTNGTIFVRESTTSCTGYEGEYYQAIGPFQNQQQTLAPQLALELGIEWIYNHPAERKNKFLKG